MHITYRPLLCGPKMNCYDFIPLVSTSISFIQKKEYKDYEAAPSKIAHPKNDKIIEKIYRRKNDQCLLKKCFDQKGSCVI